MNIVYYTLVVLIGLSVFGFDVMYLVITIAGLLVSFAFMIGSASAKYIEVRLLSNGATLSFPSISNTVSNLLCSLFLVTLGHSSHFGSKTL